MASSKYSNSTLGPTSVVTSDAMHLRGVIIAALLAAEPDQEKDCLRLMQVHDVVMAAVLAAEPELHSAARMHVPHRTNCFEVSHRTIPFL